LHSSLVHLASIMSKSEAFESTSSRLETHTPSWDRNCMHLPISSLEDKIKGSIEASDYLSRLPFIVILLHESSAIRICVQVSVRTRHRRMTIPRTKQADRALRVGLAGPCHSSSPPNTSPCAPPTLHTVESSLPGPSKSGTPTEAVDNSSITIGRRLPLMIET
jgi:hypothetical protein